MKELTRDEKEKLLRLGEELKKLLLANKLGINNDLIKEVMSKIKKLKYGK